MESSLLQNAEVKVTYGKKKAAATNSNKNNINDNNVNTATATNHINNSSSSSSFYNIFESRSSVVSKELQLITKKRPFSSPSSVTAFNESGEDIENEDEMLISSQKPLNEDAAVKSTKKITNFFSKGADSRSQAGSAFDSPEYMKRVSPTTVHDPFFAQSKRYAGGIRNMGNTCYLSAILQVPIEEAPMRDVPSSPFTSRRCLRIKGSSQSSYLTSGQWLLLIAVRRSLHHLIHQEKEFFQTPTTKRTAFPP